MTARELEEILIMAFEECSIEDIVVHQENHTINDFLRTKLGEEKYQEVSDVDPLYWMEAIRALYLSKFTQKEP